MKTKALITLLFIILCAGSTLHAQTTEEQLAVQYYQNKEYDKALVYYEKLFNKSPLSPFYNYYLNCLLETKDYKKAEKTVKKMIKTFPDRPAYSVDLGYVYRTSGEEGKAKDQFENCIKKMEGSEEYIFAMAKAFIAIKELDYAIDTYLKGRRILKGYYPFSFELADVYGQKGDLVAMTNEYLDVLETNEAFLQSVQNSLQLSFGNDADNKKNEVFRTELLKRIQKSPDKTIYSELLVWILLQQKDYEAAFTQVKALDKRKKEEGTRVMSLAQVFISNESYDMAIKAYQYVVAKGPGSFYYVNASIELLNAMYKKVTFLNAYTQNDLLELEKNFNNTLAELGRSANTVPMMKNLAHLQAFYLHRTPAAIELLEDALEIPGVTPTVQAECKLELGDILLMSGEIWEASLKYSQVEKAFKYEPIGNEAKFRNAKVSYYTGDFKWSQAQLDVLKGATSKLIANDAMDLSLLISDNSTIDTNIAPLLLFSRADLLAFQNKDDEALKKLDSIETEYRGHSLLDDVLFKKYEIAMKRGKFEEAGGYLQTLIDKYSYDVLGDDAMFRLAELNEVRLGKPDKAKELYGEVLTKFPGSLYTVEARKRYRRLRGDQLN